MTAGSRPRLLVALALVLVVALAVRVIGLDRWPGINGDEAWYGVNVQAVLEGQTPFLRTGIGNPLNPFHSVPLLLLSLVMEHTQALLRFPSVFWGFLAVLAAFPLLSAPLGARAALFVTAVLAVSPAAVSYSRFGWDPSATPFFTLMAVGLAFRDRPILAGLASLGALAIHPTNIFALPIVAGAWAPSAIARYQLAPARTRRQVWMAAAAMAVAAVPIGLWLISTPPYSTVLPSVRVMLARLVSLPGWAELGVGILAILSGVTTSIHIAGPVSPLTQRLAVVLTALAFVIPLSLGWRHFAPNADRRGPWFVAGILASLGIFQIVALAGAVQPGTERYAMFLLAPMYVLCALAMRSLDETHRSLSTVTMTLAVIGLSACLVLTYFVPIVQRGGESNASFRTGPVEPKEAAYAFIRTDSASADEVSVVAENWGIYWSLRYLAWPQREHVHVEMMAGANVPGGLRPSSVAPPAYRHRPDREYVVVYDAGGESRRLQDEGRTPLFTARDPMGRGILHVFDVGGVH